MLKSILSVVFCILLLGCDEPNQKAMASKPALLVFGASWCGPCHSMEPILHGLEAEGFRVKRIDIDREPEFAAKYGVKSVPTFVVKAKNRRAVGVQSRAHLREMLTGPAH